MGCSGVSESKQVQQCDPNQQAATPHAQQPPPVMPESKSHWLHSADLLDQAMALLTEAANRDREINERFRQASEKAELAAETLEIQKLREENSSRLLGGLLEAGCTAASGTISMTSALAASKHAAELGHHNDAIATAAGGSNEAIIKTKNGVLAETERQAIANIDRWSKAGSEAASASGKLGGTLSKASADDSHVESEEAKQAQGHARNQKKSAEDGIEGARALLKKVLDCYDQMQAAKIAALKAAMRV